MNWLMHFLAALRRPGRNYDDAAIAIGIPNVSVVVEFFHLRLPLQVLYAIWAAIACSFMFVGLATYWRMASGAQSVQLSVPTVLIIGGAGLLYECAVGIRLDARR